MNTYAYSIVTPPATLALTSGEMEEHSRAQGQPVSQYEPYLLASQAWVERVTARKLVAQTWKWFLDGWPRFGRMVLPFGQLSSVAYVKYTDSADVQATWAATDYAVSTARDPGILALKYAKTWPTATLRTLDPIEVQFACGWATAADVPSDIKSAILLLAGHLYEHRESVVVGETASVDSKALAFGVDALLANWRLYQ